MFDTFIKWVKSLFGYKEPPMPEPINFNHQTIDPFKYLVGSRKWTDWPLPKGYVTISTEMDGMNHYAVKQVWTFHDHQGDGYQKAHYGVDGWVRFTETVDGGKPYTQYFVGDKYGGTGWLVFGIDADDNWKEAVARLNIGRSEYDVLPLSYALTRYKRQSLPFKTAYPNGIENTWYYDTIVSEHYDMKTAGESKTMERSFFAENHGLTRWELWSRQQPTIGDIKERNPNMPLPPPMFDSGGYWNLVDVRQYTVEVVE